jgi:uncharacterized membrane protein
MVGATETRCLVGVVAAGGLRTLTADEITAIAIVGAAIVIALFILLGLIRWWAWKATQKPSGTGGLDLDRLRDDLAAGRITPEEYEAIRSGIAGRPAPSEESENEPGTGRDGAEEPIMDPEQTEQRGPRNKPEEEPGGGEPDGSDADHPEGSRPNGPR